MAFIRFIVLLLVVVGALNWGLVGFFKYDLVQAFLGSNPGLVRGVYGIIGLAGLYAITFFFCHCLYNPCKCNKEDR